MNNEQAKVLFRQIIAAVGVGIAAFVAGRSSISAETVLQILNSPFTATIIAPLIVWAWGLISRSDKNLTVAAAQVPGTTIITKPEIAEATPNNPNIVANTETNASINASVKENK